MLLQTGSKSCAVWRRERFQSAPIRNLSGLPTTRELTSPWNYDVIVSMLKTLWRRIAERHRRIESDLCQIELELAQEEALNPPRHSFLNGHSELRQSCSSACSGSSSHSRLGSVSENWSFHSFARQRVPRSNLSDYDLAGLGLHIAPFFLNPIY